MKTCGKCNKTKDESQYHKNRQMPDGLHSYCKPCRKKMHRDYYQANIETLNKKDTLREKRDKVKRDAKNTVAAAVGRGVIPPANKCRCAICKSKAQDYHHESYKKENWLKVVPLCRSCHRDLHCGNISLAPA